MNLCLGMERGYWKAGIWFWGEWHQWFLVWAQIERAKWRNTDGFWLHTTQAFPNTHISVPYDLTFGYIQRAFVIDNTLLFLQQSYSTIFTVHGWMKWCNSVWVISARQFLESQYETRFWDWTCRDLESDSDQVWRSFVDFKNITTSTILIDPLNIEIDS